MSLPDNQYQRCSHCRSFNLLRTQGSIMKLNTYIYFNGQCAKAFKFFGSC